METDPEPTDQRKSEREPSRRLAALSDDLALKILIAVATTLALDRLGFDPTTALLGAALSPILAELIQAFVARRGWGRRRLLLATLLLFLVHGVERARAAISRRPPRPRRVPLGRPAATRVLLATGALASALTVAGFTAADAASDHSPSPDVEAPTLTVPASMVVEASKPRAVWFAVSAVDRSDGALDPTCTHPPGTRFPIGTTRVRCRVADDAGNRTARTFTVTLVQPERPDQIIRVRFPKRVSTEATGPDGAVVTFVVAASGPYREPLAPACAPRSGSVFPIGRTTVTCTVQVGSDRTTRRFPVVVTDTTAPRLVLPGNVRRATAGSERRIDYTVSATDQVDGALAARCSPRAGSVFPLGTTEVRCSVSDERDNEARGRFTVTVVRSSDRTPPELDLPADRVAEATSAAGAIVSYEVAADDDRGDAVSIACTKESGTTFPLGRTRVECTAVDAAGNPATGTFSVTVSDTIAPALTVPGDRTTEATLADGAPVRYAASARDAVDGELEPQCSRASGSVFPFGTTRVRCNARDKAGNSADASFEVTVRDTTGPEIATPRDARAEATSASGAQVEFTVRARDLVDGRVTATCSPGSGARFPLGTTTVTCRAADQRGNGSEKSFTVEVADSTGPRIAVPADTVAEARGATGATVRYGAVRAVDAVDGAVDVTCAPASGAAFPLGDTTVTCRAADRRGNESERSFTVRVADTKAPRVFPPRDVVAEATSAAGARVAYRPPRAVDAVDGVVPATCAPRSGSTFAIGETTVTCAATDRHGNRGEATFLVTVRDTTPPELAIDDIYVEILSGEGTVVTYPNAVDAVAGEIVPTCRPRSGSFFAVRTTRRVWCSAVDPSGNRSRTVTFTVEVAYRVE